MQGLNLIHPGFLAAGLAVAVPIAIHLLFRQRTRTVTIGSVQFLRQVVREHRRRRRLRQWILLALRVLGVLLLALLFARPYWDQSHLRSLDQEVVVLVDRSASMRARSLRETAFDRGVKGARAELARLDENVIVHLATCDATGVTELSVDQLSASAATEAATDHGLALNWARDILGGSRRGTRRIVLVTDLQRSGLRTSFQQLPGGVEFVVRDVGDALPRNVAVESAQALRTEIRPGSPVTVRAVLRNHGPVPVRNAMATCDIEGGGKRFDLPRPVDLPGFGTAVVEFPLQITDDGLYRGRVSVAVDDPFELDNTRWLAFEARHPDRILVVDGEEGRSPFSSETYFLETALRLQTEETGGLVRSFEPDRMVWEAGEGFPRLDGYRAVVLANVRRLTSTDGDRMLDYVRGGGSLLIFAGDQVSRGSLSPLAERGLLPGTLDEAPVDGRWRVDDWDKGHPALACFRDPQQGDLRRVEFHRVLPVSAGGQSRVLLQAAGRTIAAERSVGRGRCLYFGATADRGWTELPRTPMYVPLMRQLMADLTGQLVERSLVTDRVVSRADEVAGITPVAGDEGRWVVTNLDPRESAPDRITEEELLASVGGKPAATSRDDLLAAGVSLPADSLRADEIWTLVAWTLLGVLAAETLLAGRVHA